MMKIYSEGQSRAVFRHIFDVPILSRALHVYFHVFILKKKQFFQTTFFGFTVSFHTYTNNHNNLKNNVRATRRDSSAVYV